MPLALFAMRRRQSFRSSVVRTVSGEGVINPELAIIVGANVSGVIEQLNCDFNTIVKKGQVCAKIDPRPFETIVDQNKANLLAAEAQLGKDKASLTYAKLNLERVAHLVKTNAVLQNNFDIAKKHLSAGPNANRT